jgi:Swiss Army Knife RNA repair-like protein
VVGTVVGARQPASRFSFTTLARMPEERPILALDVDGVISLFGFDGPPGEAPGRFHLISGMAHCIDDGVGERINRLADRYEVIWATGWEDRANERLPHLLGLPGELPYLTFDGQAQFGTAHWKVGAIDDFARDRPLAWIDDCLDDSCYSWAESRTAPTLLVPTEPFTGLTEELTETLLRWAERGYTHA